MERQPRAAQPVRYYDVDCGPGDEIERKDGKVFVVVKVVGKSYVIAREIETGRLVAWAADSPETETHWAHYKVLDIRRVK